MTDATQNTRAHAPHEPHFEQAPSGLWTRETGSTGRGRMGTFVPRERLIALLRIQRGSAGASPEANLAGARVEALLQGHARFFSIQAGNISNLSPLDQTARNLLTAINTLTQEALAQAGAALQAAQNACATVETYDSEYWDHYDHCARPQDPAQPVRRSEAYWSEHHAWEHLAGGYESLDALLCAVAQCSPAYLQWVQAMRATTPAIQSQLIQWLHKESVLEMSAVEHELSCALSLESDAQVQEQDYLQTQKYQAALALFRSQIPDAIAFLEASRAPFTHCASRLPWLPALDGPHTVAPAVQVGWPFPPVFRGDESAKEIFSAHRACAALGEWLAMAGSGLAVFAHHRSGVKDPGLQARVDALNLSLEQAWQQAHAAGALLQAIAILIKVLSDPHVHSRRCALCYRRVGVGKHKYCKVHGEHDTYKSPPNADGAAATHRTRLRQSQKVAKSYVARANALLQELKAFDFFNHPEQVLSAQMDQVAKQHPYSHTTTHTCDLALQQHQGLLLLLGPVVGEQVLAELQATSEPLCARVEQSRQEQLQARTDLVAAEAAIAERTQAFYAQHRAESKRFTLAALDACEAFVGTDLRDARDVAAKRGAALRRSAEQACAHISVEGFFTAFFARRNPRLQMADDANHPMNRGSGAYRWTGANPFNLRQIICDDLRALRAWKEIGGDGLEERIAQKRGLGLAHSRNRFGIEDVRACLLALQKGKPVDYQPTYQEVAHALFDSLQVRVTHTAIFQRVQRSGDAALKARFARKRA